MSKPIIPMDQIWKRSSLILLLLGLSLPILQAQHAFDKIAPELLELTAGGEPAACILIFEAVADLRDLAAIRGKEHKGRAVFRRLKTTAENSQQAVRQMLALAGRPYRSFVVVNAVYTTADRDLLLRLAALPEVARIQGNPRVRVLDEPVSTALPPSTSRSPVEWGLELIGIPELWAQGYRGEGIVIGGQDTGVEWTHPTLKEKYRGWEGNDPTVDHNYHWFDAITAISPLHGETEPEPTNNPCGLSVDFPCDDNNHGTYTMGISVGEDDQGNQIGVAPGARWIACRNMDRGFGSPATYLAGFEFFLAPTDVDGNNPRPELAPHVINNSWGCPEEEGCTIDNWGILETAIENLRSAGVVVVVSAGNEGPSCASVNDPPAIFAGAFAVGATGQNDTLALFSSRGPVLADGSNRLKPDVVAPGVDIRSARRQDKFMTSSGTSAAGPFVAGVVALMIQANPQLSGEVALIEQILRETAVPAYDIFSCGGFSSADIPNPMTGYGRIDATAAVEKALLTSPAGEPGSRPQITVYPNPTTGLVHFLPGPDTLDAYVEIFNTNGQLMLKQAVQNLPETIDLSLQPTGLYWWRWVQNGRTVSGKIIHAGSE